MTGITDAPATANFKGAVDQIVVSSATAGGKPTGLVAVDSDLKNFVDSVMAWYRNPNHFDTTVAVGGHVIDSATNDVTAYSSYLTQCIAAWGSCTTRDGTLATYYGSTVACVRALAAARIVFRNSQGTIIPNAEACGLEVRSFFGIVQSILTIKDFSSVSEGAIEHVADFVNIWEAGETRHEVEDLADVIEDLLDITISGNLGERIDEVQQSLFNLYALFGAQGRGTVDIPANSVIVTKRRVVEVSGWGIGQMNWHAALELPLIETYGTLGHNPTIAAYKDSGRLVSRRNDQSERQNLLAGTVTLGDVNFFTVWIALAASDRNYCNNLDYGDPREDALGLLGPNEYNSNGFAAGIVRTIGATTDAPIHTFYLGSRPVPSTEFALRDCDAL